MDFSVNGIYYWKIIATNFLPFLILHCCGQVASIFAFTSDHSVQHLSLKCLLYIDTRKFNVRIVVPNLQSLILRVQEELFWCYIVLYQCPNFFTKWQNDLNYHIARKHSAPKIDLTFKCKLCYQDFPGFFALRQHRNTHHGMQIGSGTRDVDVEHIVGDVEDHMLREELRSRQHFLGDSELEKARHKVINYAVETLNETIVNEKLGHFFNNLKCAAKVNLAFGFILKNIENGRFRYFYAHENNTPLDRSKLVCTHDDLAKLKGFLNKTDVIESCNQERMNTNGRSYRFTNLTVFAALLKEVPMGVMNALLFEPLPKNHTINCLTYEENTRQPYNDNLCLFTALALHLHGTQRLEEETSKVFNLFINNLDELSPNQCQGVHMNYIHTVADLLTLNILLYDIDMVDGNIMGELARRSAQKYENILRLLRYNNHICYVNNINAVVQSSRCPNCDTFFKRTFNL